MFSRALNTARGFSKRLRLCDRAETYAAVIETEWVTRWRHQLDISIESIGECSERQRDSLWSASLLSSETKVSVEIVS
jgi:hypothetical protein